jgi:hypothetical protein
LQTLAILEVSGRYTARYTPLQSVTKRGPGIRTEVNKENEEAETGIEKNDYEGNWKDR